MDQPPGPLESLVRQTLFGAHASREGWADHFDVDPETLADDVIAFHNLAELIVREGKMLPQLALGEDARERLAEEVPAAVAILPGRLQADVYGKESVTPIQLIRDVAASLAIHRDAILVIARGEVRDPTRIEALLAQVDLPDLDGDPGELGAAMRICAEAHAEAMVALAAGIDRSTRGG